MAKKKKQTRNKARRDQSRQKREQKRKQKKKVQSKPQAAERPIQLDPAADAAFLDSISPGLSCQMQVLESRSSGQVKRKPGRPKQSESTTPPKKLSLAEMPDDYPVPHGMPDYRGAFHPSMYNSKRLINFVISLNAVLDEVGRNGKPFSWKDVKEPKNVAFLKNIAMRKAYDRPAITWQDNLLKRVNFDWTFVIRPKAKANNPDCVEGINLRLWEEKLQRFEHLYKTMEHVDTKTLRKNGLANWGTETRIAHQKGILSEEYIARLKAAGFDLKAYDRRTKKTIEERFKRWYQRAVDAKEKYGAIGLSTKVDRQLNMWLNKQRMLQRQGKLTPERFKALNKLGVFKAPHNSKTRRKNWLHMFDTIVKKLGTSPERPVFNPAKLTRLERTWIRTQRAMHRYGNLKPDRLKALEPLGLLHPDLSLAIKKKRKRDLRPLPLE